MKKDIQIGLGAFGMMEQAIKNESNEKYSVYLAGDLCQMSAQSDFLKAHGIDVKFNNVYPCVKECDKKEVFQLIWHHKCDGWWHYDKQYVELGICTKEEFRRTLTKQCEDKKR